MTMGYIQFRSDAELMKDEKRWKRYQANKRAESTNRDARIAALEAREACLMLDAAWNTRAPHDQATLDAVARVMCEIEGMDDLPNEASVSGLVDLTFGDIRIILAAFDK